MAHDLFNIITVQSTDRDGVESFIKSVSGRDGELIGTRVSRTWKNPLIEDLEFAYLDDVRAKDKLSEGLCFAPSTLEFEAPRQRKIHGAYYHFYSRGFEGGLSDYFVHASLKFPTLRFVVQWLYPDCGELGVEELEGGSLIGRESFHLAECGERIFRSIAKEYFGVWFSRCWFG